jgi:TPR repeat protein
LAVFVLAAGSVEAQNVALGSGGEPQAPSSDTADVLELRQRAEQGEADAQFRLGVMYERGRGVPQSHPEAARWYRLAAEQGYASAQSWLGFMYSSGLGVPQSHPEAARWYRLAAEQGYASAQFSLGLMYERGRGVIQDYVEAYKWYNLATAADNPFAPGSRDRVMQRMTPAQIAEGQRRSAEWRPTNGPQQ